MKGLWLLSWRRHQGTVLKNRILILPMSDPGKQAVQVQVYIGTSWLPVVGVDWYEFAMVELTIKHYLGQAWLIITL